MVKRATSFLWLAALSATAFGQQAPSSSPLTRMSPDVASFIAQEKDALAEYLLDPATAQYKHLMVYSHPSGDDPGYCIMGEVNAKNAYGGYVGFREFVNGVIAPPSPIDQDSAAAAIAYNNESNACMQGGKLVYISID